MVLQVLAESYGQLAPAAPNPFITPLLRELRVAPGIHKAPLNDKLGCSEKNVSGILLEMVANFGSFDVG